MALEEVIETRPTGWLAILQRELKLRIGWVDETVSPFAMPPQKSESATDDHLKSAA